MARVGARDNERLTTSTPYWGSRGAVLCRSRSGGRQLGFIGDRSVDLGEW